MRDILFRGKTKDGRWVYGSLVECKLSWHKLHPHKMWILPDARSNGGWFSVCNRYPVINETVGQFTGLVDKNGTKIFEGDILLTKRGRKCKVEYRVLEGFVGFDLTPLECMNEPPDEYDLWRERNLMVVGNIYDNETEKGDG